MDHSRACQTGGDTQTASISSQGGGSVPRWERHHNARIIPIFIISCNTCTTTNVLQTNISAKQWASRTFLKPYQVLLQLSGFPKLTMLYSIFCCLPVSSASAERARGEFGWWSLIRPMTRQFLGTFTSVSVSLYHVVCEADTALQKHSRPIKQDFIFSECLNCTKFG